MNFKMNYYMPDSGNWKRNRKSIPQRIYDTLQNE